MGLTILSILGGFYNDRLYGLNFSIKYIPLVLGLHFFVFRLQTLALETRETDGLKSENSKFWECEEMM